MPLLTAAQRKLYASLSTSKGRRETGLFMAQGIKCVRDTIDHFALEALVCEKSIADDAQANSLLAKMPEEKISWAKREDIKAISTLTTAPQVIAIYRLPAPADAMPNDAYLSLALDCVQDPGNLGTIMRVADWMGVRDIFASRDTADVWNPKVVQATMGAISRVKVHYVELPYVLKDARERDIPIYGTFLEGENIYKATLPKAGIIVMGNEGNGIGASVAAEVTHKISIPSYPANAPTSESLNVAIATAITLSEFRRNG